MDTEKWRERGWEPPPTGRQIAMAAAVVAAFVLIILVIFGAML